MPYSQPPTYEATTPPVIERRRRVSYNPNNHRIIHEVTAMLTEQDIVEQEHPLWIKLKKIVGILKSFFTIIETLVFFTFIFVWAKNAAEALIK